MIKLLKTNDTHKTVSFCVLTPDVEDWNGDVISADEVIKTAHNFWINMSEKFLNIDHKDGTEIKKEKYAFVESFIAPNDIIVWENIVKAWSWYVAIKFLDEELYKLIKSWEFVWISMQGYFLKD